MSRATRLIELLALLAGRRERSVAGLAKHFGVSERTIYRDLCELSTRYPVVRAEMGWRLLDGYHPQSFHLDARERAVLHLALSNSALRKQPAIARILDGLIAKIESLDAVAEEHSGALLAGPERTGDIATGVALLIDRAVRDRVTLEISYTSLTTPGERTRLLDPYGTFHRQGVWYCAGHCHINDEMRIFRLDRIKAATATSDQFEPKPIDLEAYFADSWSVYHGRVLHEIRLWIEPDLAPLARSGALHPGAEVIEVESEGRGAIEYRLRLSHLDEIARWVVGFGSRVRVLKPDALNQRVRALAEGALRGSDDDPVASGRTQRSAE